MSDLFIRKGKETNPALECTATLLNINLGNNRELMKKCKTLKEYAQFIAAIREYLSEEDVFEEAVEKAVDECIKKGILSDILRKNRSEVIDVILTEYNENEFREFLKEESWKEGREVGTREGIEGTIKICIKLGIPKEKIKENLIEEFSLSEQEAEEYLKKYKIQK